MILLVSSNGSILHQTQERVYKGSENVNRVEIIAPFPITTTMTISFETPNGYATPYVAMVRDEQFITSDGQYLWSIDIDTPVTDYYGQVKFSFKATRLFTELGTTYTETLASGNGIFYVENNASPDLPAEPDVDVYDIILQAITDLQNGKVSRQSIAEIEDYEPNGYKAPNFLYYNCEYTINSILLKGALLVTNVTTINGETTTIIQSEYFHTSNKIYTRILTIVNGVVTIVGSWIESTVTQALLDRVTALETSMGTVQSDIDTLQSDMTTAQGDVDTLQSDMTTAQTELTEIEKARQLTQLAHDCTVHSYEDASDRTVIITKCTVPNDITLADIVKYGIKVRFDISGGWSLPAVNNSVELYLRIEKENNTLIKVFNIQPNQNLPSMSARLYFHFGSDYIEINEVTPYFVVGSASEVDDRLMLNEITDIPLATTTSNGLMSAQDKTDLDAATSALPNKADLVDGIVPSEQLPSYVDDVIECYITADIGGLPFFNNWLTLTYSSTTPLIPESGKIYVIIDILSSYYRKSYRWSGSMYILVSNPLELGETSSTAYRGDRGKTAYDHSQVTGNAHSADLSDFTDNTGVIPQDLSDLTDTTNLIPQDISDLTDTTGIISGKQNLLVSTTSEIAVGDWTANVASKTVSGVTASNIIYVSPAPTSYLDYANAQIRATAQSTDTIEFTCTTTPTETVTVNVVIG